jgi:hypothetical protein
MKGVRWAFCAGCSGDGSFCTVVRHMDLDGEGRKGRAHSEADLSGGGRRGLGRQWPCVLAALEWGGGWSQGRDGAVWGQAIILRILVIFLRNVMCVTNWKRIEISDSIP